MIGAEECSFVTSSELVDFTLYDTIYFTSKKRDFEALLIIFNLYAIRTWRTRAQKDFF